MTGEPSLRVVPAASALRAAGALITMPSLPASLRQLVERETIDEKLDWADDAWRLPDRVPAEMRPLLPAMIGEYQTAMQPANPREIAVVLGQLAVHFWHPDRPAEHHRMLFDDYISDLSEYPIGVIAEAARDWRRTERWWPKLAELRERCDAILRRRRKESARLRFLQWCAEQFDGRVLQLMRRVNGGLHDGGDGAPAWMLEEVMLGRRVFGGLVFVLPEDVIERANGSGEASPSGAKAAH